ncbi:MAG: RtcB family protein, partial [Planctomycetales bacterium]|nr:RtcB family protein [Planctomycetales bacterium]
KQACSLPQAVAGALMPDAHVGYGLPIGGVLALKKAVVPYAVGVDIACRMKLSVLDVPPAMLDQEKQNERFDKALEKGTRFGVGGEFARPLEHAVMDRDWTVSRVTRENRDKAWRQLGTSGSGNHFVEFGVLTLEHDDAELGLPAGSYTALLSHSGSRGTGAAVCSVFSGIARNQLPRKYEAVGRLAWLDLDTEEGKQYWDSMNLMGEYAAANHDCIHRNVSNLLGAQIIAGVENHHNFAWKENHGGEELIVHRKGATPAAAGELGVIPGSMADPAFIVRGKGNAASLNSASHGAGRAMSRTAAKQKFSWRATQKDLEKKGVRVLSAGPDEVPGVYKNILDVMREQRDLVDVVGRFDPRVVKMCGDGSQAED